MRYIIFFLSLFFSFLFFIPSTWVDFFLQSATGGSFRLVNSHGTLWRGSGDLILYPSKIFEDTKKNTKIYKTKKSFIVFAKNIKWELLVNEIYFYDLLLNVKLSHDNLKWKDNNIIEVSKNSLKIPDGKISFPHMSLASGSGVLAFFKPEFELNLKWNELLVSHWTMIDQKFSVEIDLVNFATSLSPINPLGSYRVTVNHDKDNTRWLIGSTDNSNLSFDASGDYNEVIRGRGLLKCKRHCEYMSSLLSAVGKKQGENVYGIILGD